MAAKTTASSGTSLFTLLTVVFVVLKLTHVITWGWLMVLMPLWIELVLGGLSLVVSLCVLGLMAAFSRH